MIRSFLSITLALGCCPLLAPALHAQQGGLFSFKSPADSLAVRGLVRGYLVYSDGHPIPYDSIAILSTDDLKEQLKKSSGVPSRFPATMPFTFAAMHTVSPAGDRAMALLDVTADSLPRFGTLVVNWVFFARKEEGAWRLSAIRRQVGLEDGIAELRFLDTSSVYPSSLKPLVARESARTLLSNAQLRTLFEENRESFKQLAGHFHRKDSLRMLGRTDRMATQINRTAIALGDAAQEIPKEAVDEYLATATKAERDVMLANLRAAEDVRRRGRDTVRKICKRLRISNARVDSAITLMRELRVSFINSELPWKDAVQFTIGGSREDVLGLLYSPKRELPWVSPEEYYCLEELGDGWWIFRST